MSKPEKTFRIGTISAAVFVNEAKADGEERSFRSVSLERRYKDGNDQWQTSNAFTLGQLPSAVAVLQMAMHHIADVEKPE